LSRAIEQAPEGLDVTMMMPKSLFGKRLEGGHRPNCSDLLWLLGFSTVASALTRPWACSNCRNGVAGNCLSNTVAVGNHDEPKVEQALAGIVVTAKPVDARYMRWNWTCRASAVLIQIALAWRLSARWY